jgi:hypothetical protein
MRPSYFPSDCAPPLPSYLAHLAHHAQPAQPQPQPAPLQAPPPLALALAPPLFEAAPPAAALPAPPVPPPAPALKECCVCLADVPLSELLALLPCMHRCVCQACADALLAAARPCPKCREPVWRASRVFED